MTAQDAWNIVFFCYDLMLSKCLLICLHETVWSAGKRGDALVLVPSPASRRRAKRWSTPKYVRHRRLLEAHTSFLFVAKTCASTVLRKYNSILFCST